VPAPGSTLDFRALHVSVTGALAAYKRPREYRIISSLWRNHMGKVMRSALVATDEG
jgi:hypothetical protein